MDDKQAIFYDPLRQAVADDNATNSILILVSKDQEYLEAYQKYVNDEITYEELNDVIVKVSVRYKNNEFISLA